MRLADRLTIVLGLLATASAIVLSIITSNVVDRSVEERAQERLSRESALLSDEVAPLIADGAGLEAIVQRAARQLGARMTVIRADGVVVADSEVASGSLGQLENHAARTEVAAARRSGDGFAVRHSATLGRDLFYLAHRIDGQGNVLRLALPYDEVRHVESQYEWRARAAIVVICLALFIAGTAALRMLVRPLRRASDDALLIAAGDTEHQLQEEGPVEIVEIASAINRMKRALLDAAAGVERERQLGATVFATLPDGTLVIDGQWRIVEANPRARSLLRAECAPGQPLIDALRDRDLFAPFEEAVRSGRTVLATVVRAGDVTWEVSVHPLPGDRVAAVGIIHDVTPFRQSEAMRRRFIADVSHELRTPVASIAAAAETLAAQRLTEDETRMLLEVIDRQTTRVRELLDDLTDLTLIESGQIQLDRVVMDLYAVTREVAADIEPAARRRNIVVVVSGGVGAPIEGDRRRVAQIIRNLIDNAVKFSADDSAVRVSVEANEHQVVLSVADSGEGIPERELSRIFQRFYQVDPSRSKSRPGSGLGLAIVKHLAQLHHATIEAESAPGVGSTFRVRFPRMQEDS